MKYHKTFQKACNLYYQKRMPDIDWILISERKLTKKDYNIIFEAMRSSDEVNYE